MDSIGEATTFEELEELSVKEGDEVWYTIPGDDPQKWTITNIWDTHTEGFAACLSRPDSTKKLGVDRCNAKEEDLEKVLPS